MVLLHLTNNILTAREPPPPPLIWCMFSATSKVLHWHQENHEENKSCLNICSINKTPGGCTFIILSKNHNRNVPVTPVQCQLKQTSRHRVMTVQ